MLLLSVVACDKYLDKDPDSRVTVDSADKVQKLLVSAYPTSTPAVVTEFSSIYRRYRCNQCQDTFFYRRACLLA